MTAAAFTAPLPPSPRLLIVEDEAGIADILSDYLTQAGFRCDRAADGVTAVETALRDQPDLILLDLMLPGLDGMGVCRELRKTLATPIIMVTARADELDRLVGLELGADDYICKPFSPREVVARVKAVLRRAPSPAPAPPPRPPLLEIDEAAQRVTVAGKKLDLTRTERRVLALLAGRPGRVYSRAQILDLAYDEDQDVSDRVVDSHVKNIRRKLAEATDLELIHAVYGVGYRFEAPTER